MNIDKKKLTILLLLLSIMVALICFGAALFKNRVIESNKSLKKIKTPKYGVQGLPYGRKLSNEPLKYTEDHIFYSDRILERFQYDSIKNDYTVGIFQEFFQSIPDGVEKTLALVPLRTIYEDADVESKENIKLAIKEINEKMPSDVNVLDVDGILKKHKDEYVYFRTDNSWTSLGAYYVHKEFCKFYGYTVKDINEFHRDVFEFYLGNLANIDNSTIDKKLKDYVEFYKLRGGKNTEVAKKRLYEDVYTTYEGPMVALSRGGTDVFVGGGLSHAIIEGDNENGATTLIIGDDNARIFIPWITPYYEKVYFINATRYKEGDKAFRKIFNDYNVKDVILLESVNIIGESIENSILKSITYKN